MEGFDVILATDEAEALEVVEDTEPGAVIVDLAELDARGAEFCRRLRDASPRLPVLMVGERDTNVRIGQLRRKLEVGGKPRLIHTVRGVGYVLREP